MEGNWISVADQLPTVTGDYLVFVDNDMGQYMSVSIYLESLGAFGGFRGEEVTHWRELPEAPNAE